MFLNLLEKFLKTPSDFIDFHNDVANIDGSQGTVLIPFSNQTLRLHFGDCQSETILRSFYCQAQVFLFFLLDFQHHKLLPFTDCPSIQIQWGLNHIFSQFSSGFALVRPEGFFNWCARTFLGFWLWCSGSSACAATPQAKQACHFQRQLEPQISKYVPGRWRLKLRL